ncbi:MAG: hypothetical protein LBR96_07515 [Treponema sp.]|jgi:hypothetical protein|nr:hypothetical protein [Treponema sp.]
MMNVHIFTFEPEGEKVLGFDTGLDAQGFAQAKLAQFITEQGFILYPEGRKETWKPAAVIEADSPAAPGEGKRMIIRGPAFEGERLDSILEDNRRREDALDALRFWIRARQKDESVPIWPGAVIVQASGAVLFPPDFLCTRCLQAEGSEALFSGRDAYVNPALKGEEAAAFSAAVMLYRIFAEKLPWDLTSAAPGDTLHQDMSEGVFLPVRLAAPGLDERLAALIDRTLFPGKGGKRADLGEFAAVLEGPPSSFVKTLSESELHALEEERKKLRKRKTASVQSRRFVIRNSTIIAAIAVAVLVAGLIARSIVAGQKDRPTTKGMRAEEVVSAYYNSFNTLDHIMMEACVIEKAGKEDINMVTNFFVMSKVRQAYEIGQLTMLSAPEWKAQGSPALPVPVFGITDLSVELNGGDESRELISYETSYKIYYPGGAEETAPMEELTASGEMPPMVPQILSIRDEVTLIRHKDAWRISEIKRRQN